jgi:DNA-directed RNA polymerase sigma subunit (sigma70/sigma32)
MQSIRESLDRPLGRFFALPAEERITKATELITELQAVVSEISDSRRVAVRDMRAAGYTLREIAEIVGTTPQRIQQIETGYNRHEKKARKTPL